MSEPGIEFRWGKGYEDPRQREQVRPTLEISREIIHDAITDLGIILTQRRRITICMPERGKPYAETTPRNVIYIRVHPHHLRLTELNVARLSGGGVHELFHPERDKVVARDNALEHVASEGFCYNAELSVYGLMHAYGMSGNKLDRNVVGAVRAMPATLRRGIRSDFLRAALAPQAGSETTQDQLIAMPLAGHWLSKGEVTAIDAVAEHREAGREIYEMMSWPTRDLLGIGG